MPPVYAAKYSNVPVWVCNIKNVNAMKRQADGWVNATHLLKVADFDKPKRTRMLERDVQSGQHEKVQGGYGKYQGTWIPLDRARELSERVGILDIVTDLLNFEPQEGIVTEELPRVPRAPAAAKNKGDGDQKGAGKAKRAKKSNSLPSARQKVPRAQHLQTMPASYNQQVPPYYYAPMPMMQQGVPQQQLTPQQMQGMGMPFQMYPNSPYMQMPPQMQSPMQQIPVQNMQHLQPAYSPQMTKPDAPPSPTLSSSALSSDINMSDNEEERPYLGGAYRVRDIDGNTIDPAAAAAARVRLQNQQRASHAKSFSNSSSSSSLGSSAAQPQSVTRTASQLQPNSQQPQHLLQAPSTQMQPIQPPSTTQAPLSQYMADYSSKLLDFFMSSDKTVIPSALLNPQRGPHINQPIDDEGNTAFHWTCAIGRIEVMKALVNAGASIHALNNAGQKPLVRAVLFTNNYEARSFPKVLEMLAETADFVDRTGRTILHHIAGASSSGTRASSARYYAEILLAKLTASPALVNHNLHSFVNQQDINGDTALHICGRANARRLAKVLLSYNALPNIPNKAGITPEDTFQQFGDRFGAQNDGAYPKDEPETIDISNTKSLFEGQSRTLGAAARVSQTIAGLLSDFAKAYDKVLANKDSDISQVRDLLNQIRDRITETEIELPQLETKTGSEDQIAEASVELERHADAKSLQLRHLIERSQARDLALLVQKEETDVQRELQEQLKQPDQIREGEQLELAQALTDLQNRRAELLDDIIVLYSNSGSREKIKKYRKLLAVCCEVAEDEVDGLLDGITQALST